MCATVHVTSPPCRLQGLNAGCQAGQAPLPAEPLSGPMLLFSSGDTAALDVVRFAVLYLIKDDLILPSIQPSCLLTFLMAFETSVKNF